MDQEIIKQAEAALALSNCRVQLRIPSVLAEGETFTLKVTVFGADSMPVSEFPYEIKFTESCGIENLPGSIFLSSSDKGCLTIDNLKAVKNRYAVIRAEVTVGNYTVPVNSNPAWIFENPKWRIFWGDIHIHTTFSNCSDWACKHPEWGYLYARDYSCLDFAAAGDHLHGIASEEGRWEILQSLTEQYEEEGKFIPLLGFESSHASGFGGDNNAYYKGTKGPYFWLDRPDMEATKPKISLQELWDFLDKTGLEYMTVPHHTGRSKKYRSFEDDLYDAKRERLFEIYSCWGSSEFHDERFRLKGGNSDKPCYFTDAVKAGCRFGVIASGDDHRTMPGGERMGVGTALGTKSQNAYLYHGLAAVKAEKLTRDHLWDAMYNKSCYATTLDKVLLDIKVGDINMGEEGSLSANDSLRKKREIKVNILADSNRGVRLVRNGEVIAKKAIEPFAEEFSFVDEDPIEDIAVRDAKFHPEPFVSYYVRVDNKDGQTQWSSPVWIDV
ncbi:MAG: PHP domain-containing protein [Planctomycetota bacterium]